MIWLMKRVQDYVLQNNIAIWPNHTFYIFFIKKNHHYNRIVKYFGTKPLLEPMLTCHQRCAVTFTSEQFHKNCSGTSSLTHWGRDKMDTITQTTFSSAFFWKKIWIPTEISLKFVPKGPINNIPSLVQIMAWRHPGNKPLSEPMMVSYWRIYVSLGLNELTRVWRLRF